VLARYLRNVTDRELLAGRPVDVAPRLLGSVIRTRVEGRVVAVRLTEVEAYGGTGEDPGSHAYRGRTARTASMFGPPGHAYQYFVYGMHWALNVVTSREGDAGAVLLRAGEIVRGLDVARGRRSTARRDRDLARGPACLAQSIGLGLGESFDGTDVLEARSAVRLLLGDPVPLDQVGVSARTGVSGPGALTPWRFYLLDNPTVSPYRPANPRRRR
jgi:DNA-3-methyladenine glycosylase